MYRGLCIDEKYRLEDLLGEGGTGAVYRAVQLSLERPVAVKFLRHDVEVNRDAVEQLKREALAVSRLRHPNIVSIVDFGVSPVVGPFLVFEYLDGRSLAAELTDVGRMPAGEATDLLLPVCRAIGAAHDAGIVHRDLKPANLFAVRTETGISLKVLDFGISAFHGEPIGDGEVLAGTVVGTPLYMSPEQCDGLPADVRSDVYSLGCILYEMLTGRPPFVAETVAGILERQRTQELRRPSFLAPGVPTWLDDVLLRACAKDPRDRFRTASGLAAALETENGLRSCPDASGQDGPTDSTPDDPTRSNLPPETNAFVGRDREIDEIAVLLVPGRLVTLAGPGGIGKTRLAREVARSVAHRFPDGVWLVELAGLYSPDLVVSAVAQVLGVRESSGRPLVDSLSEAVAGSSLLLVLDNCEHVVDACAELATALLRASPGLHVLATSREVFGVDGEVVWTVPPLSAPRGETTAAEAMHHASVRLFVERARLSRKTFELTDQNAQAVSDLCRTLDGLPLAIELAAARVATLRVADLVARMSDRFRILDGGGRGALPRHRTLRAALDWSYDLLTADEQALLTRLPVFAGGFTLEAAESVGAGPPVDELAVFDVLRRLVDKSLVTVDEHAGSVRFRLLETIRVYSREKLFASGEETARLRGHCQWCVELAEQALAETEGPRRDEWNRKLEADHDNLRAGLQRAIDSRDSESALRLSAAMNRYWATVGFLSEGRQWIESALALAGDSESPRRAAALLGLARLALIQADHRRAVDAADECLKIRFATGDRAGVAAALGIKALAVGRSGRYDEAYAIQEESLAISRELGLDREANESVFYMGLLAMYRGDFDRAGAHFDESLEAYRAADNRHKVVVLLHNVGEVAWFRRDAERARAALEECLRLAEGLGLRRLVADTHRSLGRAVGDLGDVERAMEMFRASLRLQREIGNREGVIEVVEGSACVAAACGQQRRAVKLAAAAAAAREDLAIPPDSGFQRELDGRVARAASHLESEEVDCAIASGRAMTLDEAAALAVDERGAE